MKKVLPCSAMEPVSAESTKNDTHAQREKNASIILQVDIFICLYGNQPDSRTK
jgi:hypothetical protein